MLLYQKAQNPAGNDASRTLRLFYLNKSSILTHIAATRYVTP